MIVRALERDRERRYPNARAMSDELTRALQDLGGSIDLTAPAEQVFLVPPRAEPEAKHAGTGARATGGARRADAGAPAAAAP